MRLLAGAQLAQTPSRCSSRPRPSGRVVAGDWLRDTLAQLRGADDGKDGKPGPDPQPELRAQLRPYQRQGVRWLWWLNRLGLGG
jgi:non-specific serine/threonine protein kinase